MIPEKTMSQPTVRCKACELRQYVVEGKLKCRRCGLVLPRMLDSGSAVTTGSAPPQDFPAAAADRPRTITFASDLWLCDPLPQMDELQAALFEEALARCNGNAAKAAGMVGVGKTTMCRWRRLLLRRNSQPLIPPHVGMGALPMEALLDDETLVATRVEGLDK